MLLYMQAAERITVSLIDKASRALDAAAKRSGMNKTDVVNRALQVYDYIDSLIATDDNQVLIQSTVTGEIQRLRLM
jgi:hypothetical protein